MEQSQKRQLVCLQIHNDYLIPGGETKSAKLIADLLEMKGIKVIRYYKNNEVLSSNAFLSKIIVGFKSVYNKDTVKDILNILRVNHVDFAIVHNTSPIISNSVYSVLKRKKIKVFKYLQNYNLMCLNGALDAGKDCNFCVHNPLIGVRNRCYKGSVIYSLQKYLAALQMRRKYLSEIYRFIAISEFVKKKHVAFNIPQEKIEVLYHFCESPAKILAENQISRGNRYIVYMGRLSKEKGIMTLVQAVSKIHDIKLKILGTGDMENDIRNYIREHHIDNIEIIGYKTGHEKDLIVGNALALVAPSEWEEPFGRIVIEAYQVGTPVIASSIGGLVELVDDGITGYKYKPGSVIELQNAIERISNLSDACIYEMREACAEMVNKKFSKDEYYNHFCKLIDSQ